MASVSTPIEPIQLRKKADTKGKVNVDIVKGSNVKTQRVDSVKVMAGIRREIGMLFIDCVKDSIQHLKEKKEINSADIESCKSYFEDVLKTATKKTSKKYLKGVKYILKKLDESPKELFSMQVVLFCKKLISIAKKNEEQKGGADNESVVVFDATQTPQSSGWNWNMKSVGAICTTVLAGFGIISSISSLKSEAQETRSVIKHAFVDLIKSNVEIADEMYGELTYQRDPQAKYIGFLPEMTPDEKLEYYLSNASPIEELALPTEAQEQYQAQIESQITSQTEAQLTSPPEEQLVAQSDEQQPSAPEASSQFKNKLTNYIDVVQSDGELSEEQLADIGANAPKMVDTQITSINKYVDGFVEELPAF